MFAPAQALEHAKSEPPSARPHSPALQRLAGDDIDRMRGRIYRPGSHAGAARAAHRCAGSSNPPAATFRSVVAQRLEPMRAFASSLAKGPAWTKVAARGHSYSAALRARIQT